MLQELCICGLEFDTGWKAGPVKERCRCHVVGQGADPTPEGTRPSQLAGGGLSSLSRTLKAVLSGGTISVDYLLVLGMGRYARGLRPRSILRLTQASMGTSPRSRQAPSRFYLLRQTSGSSELRLSGLLIAERVEALRRSDSPAGRQASPAQACTVHGVPSHSTGVSGKLRGTGTRFRNERRRGRRQQVCHGYPYSQQESDQTSKAREGDLTAALTFPSLAAALARLSRLCELLVF